MTGWWWLVVVLAVIGVALLVVGLLRARAAEPEPGSRGGFGGPPGTSDVGVHPGFEASGPYDHWREGARLRVTGLVALAASAVLAVILAVV